MKEFIYSNLMSMLVFCGITIRIDAIIIDTKACNYAVTKRTCNKRDEETWMFNNILDAISKYKELIKTINTSWGNEIADLIK